MEQPRGFLLGWRTWTLWLIPVVATLYFVWVLMVGLGNVRTPTVDIGTWVLLGLVIFGVLFVLELLLLVRRKEKDGAPAVEPADAGSTIPAYLPPGEAAANGSAFAPPPPRERADAEWIATSEMYRGLRVLEVSMPPKSRNKGGVYAKSYVAVGPDAVVRIEDLVADKADFPRELAPSA